MRDSASDAISLLEQDYESYNLILFDKYNSKKDRQGSVNYFNTIYNKSINYKIVQPQYYSLRDFKISKYKKRNLRKALKEEEFEILLNFDIQKIPSAKKTDIYTYSVLVPEV